MAFADITAKTVIDPAFSAAGRTAILAAMKTAYDGSAVGKAMFDDWIATAGHTIDIKSVAGVFQAYTGTGRVEIDLGYINDLSYISDTGTPVLHSLLGALVHELGHALHGTRDNTSATDYQGANVRYVNTIWAQLGLDKEISYIAQARSTIHTVGYKYTKGATIDAAESGNRSWNSAALGTSNDLLIGGASGNVLQAGAGNDFVFGAGGDDDINGGAGRDTAVYTGTQLDYDIRKSDDGSWTVRNARGAKAAGADTLKNVEVVQFDGTTFDLIQHGLTFQTDFALVIDTTGSMGSSIGSVKAQASALIDAAFGGGTSDARIGVVGFKDTTNGEPSSVILAFTDQDSFADRKTAALAAINSISVGGGGDTPETALDGLKTALDGSMGKWRYGAGILRVALFTDAPAKDGALAATVSALAHRIGATVTASAAAAASAGRLDTFDLTFAATSSAAAAAAAGLDEGSDASADPVPVPALFDDPIIPPTTTSQVQIFTIFTGPSGTVTTPLSDIATANGGALLIAPTNDELIAALRAIITAPTAPVITGLTPATDDGASSSDGITSVTVPVIVGTAVAGGTITVLSDGVSLGTTLADGSGAWSFTPASPIALGAHSITATAANSGGNTSAPSSAFALTIRVASPDLTVINTTTGNPVAANPVPYTGPVVGLEHEYINITADNLNASAATDNWFIHTGDGNDAIAAHGGINVLDGGNGSNFLTGGSGLDTFFLDQRVATSDIWSTIVGFAAGEVVTLWGIKRDGFVFDVQNNEGADGYRGLTLHVSATGKPVTSVTLAGYSATDLLLGRVTAVFGTDAGSASSFMSLHANA